MLELALHILDIAENAVRARANVVTIQIREDLTQDLLTIALDDDGEGMSPVALKRAVDPFYTTKKVRRVGLGLPLLAEAARQTGGWLKIRSAEGRGTHLEAVFGLSHIDRQPLGDMGGTLVTLIVGHPEMDFIYRHDCDDRTFRFDTREIRQEMEGCPIHHREVVKFIKTYIQEGLQQIGTKA